MITSLQAFLAENPENFVLHSYTLTQSAKEGHWGAHCLACSYLADDYVYPCHLRLPGVPVPPILLRDADG